MKTLTVFAVSVDDFNHELDASDVMNYPEASSYSVLVPDGLTDKHYRLLAYGLLFDDWCMDDCVSYWTIS